MKANETGRTLEEIILPSLKRNDFAYETQVNVGKKPNGRRHVVDLVINNNNRSVLVSLKWQQVAGTAEQKIPWEMICLQYAKDTNDGIEKAYLVLGGDGWKMRDFFIDEGLKPYLKTKDVEVISLERFLAQTNRKDL